MVNPILQAFGNHLRTLRKKRNVSQEKLAELAKLHRTYLGRVERGERNPTLLTLVKIAQGLNINLVELVDIDDILSSFEVTDTESLR